MDAIRELLRYGPSKVDSQNVLLLELADALEANKMADIKTLLAAVSKLALPAASLSVEEISDRLREALGDDRKFNALTKELLKPNAYDAEEVKQIFNLVLQRNQRFAKSSSKKKIVEQLISEREIVLANDNAREVIRAHSSKA